MSRVYEVTARAADAALETIVEFADGLASPESGFESEAKAYAKQAILKRWRELPGRVGRSESRSVCAAFSRYRHDERYLSWSWSLPLSPWSPSLDNQCSVVLGRAGTQDQKLLIFKAK